MGGCFRSKRRLLLPPLLREDFAGNSKHSLETLAALSRVLAEPVNGDFLDAVLNFLPAAAHRDDLGGLVEDGLARGGGGSVADGLLHREELAPGQILGAHCDRLFARVDVGDFVDEAGFVGAEKGLQPGGQGLFACDETLGAKLWRDISMAKIEGFGERKFVRLTIPVSLSSERFSTSTPMTCSALSFQGQYLRQLFVDTSSHE